MKTMAAKLRSWVRDPFPRLQRSVLQLHVFVPELSTQPRTASDVEQS
jgi:hypothetical protein